MQHSKCIQLSDLVCWNQCTKPVFVTKYRKEELSWREVEELMAEWKKNPPAFLSLHRLEQMYAKAHGYRVKEKGRRLSGDEAIEALKRQGWL